MRSRPRRPYAERDPTLRPDSLAALLGSLSEADDALSRLDARLAGSSLAAGWLERVAFQEAVAWMWNQGELVPIEDLVLHDARLDVQAPDTLVTAAHGALKRRRRSARVAVDMLRTWPGVSQLLGRRPAPPSPASAAVLAALAPTKSRRFASADGLTPLPSPALAFLSEMVVPSDFRLDQDEEVFAFWSARREALDAWPALVGAAVQLDLWTQLQPLPRAGDVGDLIVEAELRTRRRLVRAPLLIETGRRALGKRSISWAPQLDPQARATYWLKAMALGARAGLAELDSLSIGRQRMDRLLTGRRTSSRLKDLADLFLRSPLVTAPHAAAALNVSQQAIRVMIADLGPTIREATGRRRYRAWRI